MDFMKLLKSFEELLYEIASWLVFYPVTFWRTLSRPSAMMRYADAELADRDEDRYTDTLSPPLFLLVTLLIAHGCEVALARYEPVWNRPTLLASDANLLLFRALMFGIFPLLMSVKLIRRKGARLDRERLRPPFYSQCYVAAVFALGLSIAGQLAQMSFPVAVGAGLSLFVVVLGWYATVEIRWFRADLGIGTGWAAAIVVTGLVEGFILMVLVAALVAFGLPKT